MVKRLLFLFVLALLTLNVMAQQITEQQAKERALRYLASNSAAKTRGLNANATTRLDATKVEAQSIYAFNIDGGGYVIASADSRSLPVLGYSAKGKIDWEKMPENMRVWLKSYDAAMKTLGNRNDFVDGVFQHAIKVKKTRAERAPINPLLKTTWDQGFPYNNKVPLYEGANPDYEGEASYVGCIATAMAQIMNYHKWPRAATSEIPAYDLKTAYQNKEKIWHIEALPSVTFDWDNMLDTYVVPNYELKRYEIQGTKAQQDAVATLMRYCSQSVYMGYSPEGSYSDAQEVVEALVKYFGYDPALRSVKRVCCGIDEWEQMIYDELAEGRPVQYSGDTDETGHSFVCDGYDGNGLFHINWGWEGTDDGYFALAVLNPYNNTSAGASSSRIGFCMGQDVIIGVKPAPEGTHSQTAIPQVWLDDFDPIRVEGQDTVRFSYKFRSYSYDNVLVDFALGTREEDGTLKPIYKGDPSDSIVYNMSSNFHDVWIDSTLFKPGDLQVLYPMLKFPNIPDNDWHLVGSLEYNVIAGRTDDNRFFLFRLPPDLEIKKIGFTGGPARVAMSNEIKATIYNNGPFESTMPLVLLPYYFGDVKLDDITDDTPYSEGDPLLSGVYLRVKESADVTFGFKPMRGGIVYLALCLPDGTALADCVVEVENLMGTYDEYVENSSYYEQKDTYDGDYQATTVEDDGEVHLGHLVYHVNFADIPDVTVPNVKPSDSIYLHARISDAAENHQMTYKREEKAIYDYLVALPEKAKDGSYKFSLDIEHEIRRGGWYYVWSYINEKINWENMEDITSCEKYKEFIVRDEPSIRLVGDTAVASGQPLNLELHLTTGFPYTPKDFTGSEKARYTLYDVADNGQLTERRSGGQTLSFAKGERLMAVVDTMMVGGTLPDGNYLLRVSSDWSPLGTRDIRLSVGSTGIKNVARDEPTVAYTDLRGVRREGRPNRKGIYVRGGRKVVVK